MLHLTHWIVSLVDWPRLLGSQISKIPPNLFSQYGNFCSCYCCQNSNQSAMNKTCCREWFLSAHIYTHGLGGTGKPDWAFPSPAGSSFIFGNFEKKKKRNNIFRMILLLLSPSINGYQTSVFSPSRLEYCLINVTSRCWEAQAALGTTDETG